MLILYTVGSEGLTLAEFLELLARHGIRQLVDLRETPSSRKAGFGRTEFAAALEAAGIRYRHSGVLGCPKPIRDRLREGGDWSRYRRDLAIYLDGQGAALAELRALAAAAVTCLYTPDADPQRCARGPVAAAAFGPGDQVRHLPARPPSPQAELALD